MGIRAWVYGQSANRGLSISLRKHATVFQAEVYAILDCVHENETQDRPETYVGICSDSQAALKALQAAKTTPPLVRQCQKALNISTQHAVGLYWVPGHARVRGNEIANKTAGDSSIEWFVGPEPFLGVSRQNIRRNAGWKNSIWYCGTVLVVKRQAREMISGPDLATKKKMAQLLSFNPSVWSDKHCSP